MDRNGMNEPTGSPCAISIQRSKDEIRRTVAQPRKHFPGKDYHKSLPALAVGHTGVPEMLDQ